MLVKADNTFAEHAPNLIYFYSFHIINTVGHFNFKDLSSCLFLGCLDTLATMQDLKMGVASTEEETQAVMKVYSKEDYSVVNRFESMYVYV